MKKFKAWWIDFVAWLQSYRTLPSVVINADEIKSSVSPVLKANGRLSVTMNVTGDVIVDNPDLFEAPDSLTKIETTVTTKEFFTQLDKWYQPDFNTRSPYLVKFYCQAQTFSFDIYKEDRAFFGDPAYRSEIYDWWHTPEDMYQILRDIEKQLFILKTNN